MSYIPPSGVASAIICILLVLIALLALFLRLWSRKIQNVKLQINDYAVIVAMIILSGLAIDLLIIVFAAGQGLHVQEVTSAQVRILSTGYAAGQFLWVSANSAVKVSILHLYMVVFPVIWMRRACYALMALTACYLTAYTIIGGLCTPWNFDGVYLSAPYCGVAAPFLFSGYFHLAINFVIFLLPMPILWRLQMPLAKKFGIAAMFGIGILICVCTVLRILSIAAIDIKDVTYTSSLLTEWVMLEPALGVVDASLPVMKPALRKIFGPVSAKITRRSRASSSTERAILGRTGGANAKSGDAISAPGSCLTANQVLSRSAPMRDLEQGEAYRQSLLEGSQGSKDNLQNSIRVTNAWTVRSMPVNGSSL